MADEAFTVTFDLVDAKRIKLAAYQLNMTEEEYIRWATQRVIERHLDDWLLHRIPSHS